MKEVKLNVTIKQERWNHSEVRVERSSNWTKRCYSEAAAGLRFWRVRWRATAKCSPSEDERVKDEKAYEKESKIVEKWTENRSQDLEWSRQREEEAEESERCEARGQEKSIPRLNYFEVDGWRTSEEKEEEKQERRGTFLDETELLTVDILWGRTSEVVAKYEETRS